MVACNSLGAAYVGAATEVHAPGVGTVPVPADETRYVFHDIASRKYGGALGRGRAGDSVSTTS